MDILYQILLLVIIIVFAYWMGEEDQNLMIFLWIGMYVVGILVGLLTSPLVYFVIGVIGYLTVRTEAAFYEKDRMARVVGVLIILLSLTFFSDVDFLLTAFSFILGVLAARIYKGGLV